MYVDKICGGAKKDSLKWIERRVEEHGEDFVKGCILNYAAVVDKKKTEKEYRIQPHNFFGTKLRYLEFQPKAKEEVRFRVPEPGEELVDG